MKNLLYVIGVVAVSAVPVAVSAATSTWVGGSGSWSIGNWQDAAPGAGDTAVLDSVSSGTRTVRIDAGAASVQKIVMRQQSDAGVNSLVLDADFDVSYIPLTKIGRAS